MPRPPEAGTAAAEDTGETLAGLAAGKRYLVGWPSDHAGVTATPALHTLADGTELPWVLLGENPASPGEQALFVVGTQASDSYTISPRRGDQIVVQDGRTGRHSVVPLPANAPVYVYGSCQRALKTSQSWALENQPS